MMVNPRNGQSVLEELVFSILSLEKKFSWRALILAEPTVQHPPMMIGEPMSLQSLARSAKAWAFSPFSGAKKVFEALSKIEPLLG